jgi:hypothetical protein
MPADLVIEDELRAWLEALPAAVAAGAKCYPWGQVPQAPTYPHWTYYRVSGRRVRALGGPSGVSHPRLQLDTWARDYKTARALADAARVALEEFTRAEFLAGRVPRFVAGGRRLQSVIVHDCTDAAEEPGHGDEKSEHRVTLDVTIWFQETD